MRHQDILDKMTVEEKAAMLSGASEWTSRGCERLGVPGLFFSDGPHGIRKQEGAGDHLGLNESLPATCFPTAATAACSWDEELCEAVGRALGKEAAAQGVDVLLGPGLNIKRSPLCGRNFEYFSEDPYLSGRLAAAYVRGIQSQGVSACVKHYAVNSQELRRMAMNAVVDERTLREIYLTGFEIAVKEGGAKALMTSYNEVNGVYANENEHLLLDILRKEWGFEGLVVTDWGASNDHVRAVKCRSNLEMPTPGLDSARELLEAVKSGALSMEELDACVDDLLDAALGAKASRAGVCHAADKPVTAGVSGTQEKPVTAGASGTAGKTGCATASADAGKFDKEAHHRLAARAARESIVLLKNEDAMLPLRKGCKAALIGDFAKAPRYQGAGSSMVKPTSVECMADLMGKYPLQYIGYAQGWRRTGETDAELKKEALALAAEAEVVLYCFGLDETSESEGVDREHMKIPANQRELLRELSGVNKNIVGILSAGSAVEMPWLPCCRALLYGALGGQAGAGAMLDVLAGAYNPCGRLAETYPLHCEDTPASPYYPAARRSSQYREGIYVGYRYYDTVKAKVQFPFGYGLSYTTFAYSDLQIEEDGASFTVSNTGDMDGAETAQLYVGAPGVHVFCPEKELKGFVKVFLASGESRRVKIPFDHRTFRYWNCRTDRFEIEGGAYRILVGASVEDIRLSGTCEREATTEKYPYQMEAGRSMEAAGFIREAHSGENGQSMKEKPFGREKDFSKMFPSYASGEVHKVSDKEYAALLGYVPEAEEWSGILTRNDAICQMYYARSRIARLVCRALARQKKKNEERGRVDLNILFIYNMPFRAIAKMTHGAVGMRMVDGIVLAVNGHFLKGLGGIIGGFFANRRGNRKYEKYLEEIGADEKA